MKKCEMLNKDDELEIICQFDEKLMEGSMRLDLVRKVIFDFVQVGPMWTAFFN
jgi:hypothetical protein